MKEPTQTHRVLFTPVCRRKSGGILTKRRELFLHELLNGPIHRIGDVNLALRAYRDEVRFAELAPGTSGSRFPHRGENFSVEIELENLTREAVDHVDVPVSYTHLRAHETGRNLV